MKIYTKTGDDGTTALIGGSRVSKHHSRIECYGTIDELNSYMGLIRDQNINKNLEQFIIHVQNKLFTIGAILATDPEKNILKNGEKRLKIEGISADDIKQLEIEIDTMNESLPELTQFILPGGHQTVSFCHVARCVCRRAERLATAINDKDTLEANVLAYLNRLSDYLFVLARKLTLDMQAKEIKWTPKKNKP